MTDDPKGCQNAQRDVNRLSSKIDNCNGQPWQMTQGACQNAKWDVSKLPSEIDKCDGQLWQMTQRACQNANWGVNKFFSKIDNCDECSERRRNSCVDQRVANRPMTQLTKSRQQMSWGYTWRVQFDHLWGSILFFQLSVGVSCGIGLRHGVTMHPWGQHSREGMILLPHGTYT